MLKHELQRLTFVKEKTLPGFESRGDWLADVFRLGAPASRRRFSTAFAQLAGGDASAPRLIHELLKDAPLIPALRLLSSADNAEIQRRLFPV